MIYTSNYFNPITLGCTRVSISVSRPDGYKSLPIWRTVAPDWDTILKPYKDGVIGDAEYTRRYLQQLNSHRDRIIVEARSYMNSPGDVVLLCWCRKGNFCHRRLLADWLKNNGFDEIKEL